MLNNSFMKESFGSDLKKEMSNQVMNIDSFNVDPIESIKTMNKLTNSISEEDDEDDDDTNSETTEATSAGGGSGQYSEPLFSTTKREMEKGGSKLNKVEATEATSSASSGQYSTPAFVAKDSKNWRGNKKPQIPGGKFVKIKDKCRKFPYCNQGDINALKIFENKSVKKAIKTICEKYDVSENVVKSIIVHEYESKILNK
tara:strand:- start:2360 stop:2959 length:600 start_codon:yes stop_codon:yes gene_type:complete